MNDFIMQLKNLEKQAKTKLSRWHEIKKKKSEQKLMNWKQRRQHEALTNLISGSLRRETRPTDSPVN